MSIQKLRNKFSVGAYIKKIAEIWDKVNEIIDNLNGDGATGSGSYKVYVALISQSGAANAPTTVDLENTLGGTITWGYSSPGTYTGTLTGAFTADKTAFYITSVEGETVAAKRTSANTITIQSFVGGIGADDLLINTTLEVRVYN